MSQYAIKAGRKVFEKNLQQYEPIDPLYETYTDKKGRQRRRKRETPPGLSKRDVKILRSVQKRAHYLDKGFRVCGMRFGWTFFIGIIPGAGDIADAVLNYVLVVRKAQKAEIPDWLLGRMLVNNAISAGVGLVPIAGDIILAMYKANSRNAALLEEYLRVRGAEFLAPENERKQDAKVVKPGAGRKPNEVIPGAVPTAEETKNERSGTVLSGASGWFRRGSKSPGSKKDKDKGKTIAAPESAAAPPPYQGRFIEDVPPSTSEISDVKRK